jgi:hypothetical protein
VGFNGSTGGQMGQWWQLANDCTFFCGNENADRHLGMGFSIHQGIRSEVKRVKFISDRMSYIILKGHWYYIIVLNVHALTEDVSDDIKDSVYEEAKHVFDQFTK